MMYLLGKPNPLRTYLQFTYHILFYVKVLTWDHSNFVVIKKWSTLTKLRRKSFCINGQFNLPDGFTKKMRKISQRNTFFQKKSYFRRYIAIVRPLKPRMSKTCARIFLFIIWISSAIVSIPSLLYSKTWTFT